MKKGTGKILKITDWEKSPKFNVYLETGVILQKNRYFIFFSSSELKEKIHLLFHKCV